MTSVPFSRKLCLCGRERLYAGWERRGHEKETRVSERAKVLWFTMWRPVLNYENVQP